MSSENAFFHALAAFLPCTGIKQIRDLLNAAGGAENAWLASEETLQKINWTDDTKFKFQEHRKKWKVEQEFARLENTDILFYPETHPEFPACLKEIFDPPVALYVRGTVPQNQTGVAFVGSRKATPYGKTATSLLARPLAARGIVIVSGLAYGIDAEAHRAAIETRGKTWGVLGNGCDEATMYPRSHRQLARDIINSGGAVISEFPPSTPAMPHFFPMRNRIVAGLSRAVVVVEAAEKSGALITARLALDQNRDVFAVPGPITSEMSRGTNTLIRDGATPLQNAEELLEALKMRDFFGQDLMQKTKLQVSQPNTAQDPASENIRSFLSHNPLSIDEIVKKSTLPPQAVTSAITMMEINGMVKDVGGRNYIIL